MRTDLIHELELLVRSRYRLIFIETPEEGLTDNSIRFLASRLRLPYFTWKITDGLVRKDIRTGGPIYKSEDISVALEHIYTSNFPGIYHIKHVEGIFDKPEITSRLKDIAIKYSKTDFAVIVTGYHLEIPYLLKPYSSYVELPPPDVNEYRTLLDSIIRDVSLRSTPKIELDETGINLLLNSIKGLSLTEAEKVLTRIIVEDNKLSSEDIVAIRDIKKSIIEKDGILEYFPFEETLDDIADLKNLKRWLAKRKRIISNPLEAKEFGLSFPKGVLLIGVPGCGKSLCAKAVANEWSLPLLKFDTSNLYDKYIGETEKNLKRVFTTAEKMSPVILWIDEIEKAFTFSASNEDSGLSARVFGSFLSWMQERRGDVFIVATANDVSRLPPEFLRKGRFDEIFFVDLPDAESREAIFAIHLKKRGRDPRKFDLSKLATLSDGFTGSEIEQVVVSALYTAFSEKKELTTEILEAEIKMTLPLSVTMAEKINSLREWAKDKSVMAN